MASKCLGWLFPGVGKKTAARMILELREKLALPEVDTIPRPATPGVSS